MQNTPIVRHGLNPTQKDARDYKVGALFRLPELKELPKSFRLNGFRIKDQVDTDFCSGYMSCGMSELQEGVELNPAWAFAVSKMMSGNVDEYGQDLRTAMKVHVKHGAVEGASPADSGLRHIGRWAVGLFEEAKKHKKQTFLDVSPTQKYDAFDTIRATIWKFRDEKRAIGTGVQFSWDISQEIFDTIGEGGGHAMYVIGWETIKDVPYLVYVNSYGEKAGDHGVHYVSREVVNHFVAMFQAFMFVDMPNEQVKYMLDNGIKHGDNWVIQLFKTLKTIVVSPFLTLEEKINIIKMTNETVKTVTIELEPRIKLAEFMKSNIGTDISPNDVAPDNLSCAESVCNAIRKSGVAHDFPILTYTPTLHKELIRDKRFKVTLTPRKGVIIISPTGMGNGKIVGHVGVFIDDYHIASTTGERGNIAQNFTLDTWVRRYRAVGGLPIYMFEPVIATQTMGAIELPQEDLPFSREQVVRVISMVFTLVTLIGFNPEAHGLTQNSLADAVMTFTLIATFAGNAWGYLMRYKKGDVTLGGFRK